MSIVEKAAMLEQVADQHRDLARTRQEARDLRKLRERVEHVTVVATAADELFQGVGTAMRSVALPRTKLKSALLLLQKTDAQLAETAQLEEPIRATETALAELDAAVRASWRSVVTELMPPDARVRLASQLSTLPALREQAGTLVGLYAEMQSLRDGSPSGSGYARIEELAATFDQEYGRLDLAADPDVEAFLKACAEGGAPLHMLSERVVAWLRDHRLTTAFVITPAQRR